MYGGYELAQIRDQKELDSEEELCAYVDESVLSTTVLQQDAHSDETMAPLVTKLKDVLSYKVCFIQHRSHQAASGTL